MGDSKNDRTADVVPEFKRLTPEQQQLMDLKVDTMRDTTMDGRPRCEYRYMGIDDFNDAVRMRCTEAAKLRVLITEQGESFWALTCYGCCPHSDQIEEL